MWSSVRGNSFSSCCCLDFVVVYLHHRFVYYICILFIIYLPLCVRTPTHTHTGRDAFMTFICVCFCLCVCCLCVCVCVFVCVPPQPPSPCSVYFISYSLEFHFALFTKGRGAGGNGARKKRICYGQKNGSHIGGNALTTGNFFVLLCSFPLPIQPSAASPYLPPYLPPSLPGICSRRSQLARENTRAHTHARSIFRC